MIWPVVRLAAPARVDGLICDTALRVLQIRSQTQTSPVDSLEGPIYPSQSRLIA